MNTTLRNFLLTTLTAKKGVIVNGVVSFLASYLVAELAKHQFDVPAEVVDHGKNFVALTLMLVIERVILSVNATGTKQVQEVLQDSPSVTTDVKVDGVPGAVTIAAVKEAANQ